MQVHICKCFDSKLFLMCFWIIVSSGTQGGEGKLFFLIFLSSWQKEVESAVWDISQQVTAWN